MFMWEMNYDQSCLGVFGDYKVCWNCIEDVEIVNLNADRACLTSRAINSIIWQMKGTCLILSRMWRKKIKVEIWVLMNMTWFVSINSWLPLFNPLFFPVVLNGLEIPLFLSLSSLPKYQIRHLHKQERERTFKVFHGTD